MVLTFSKDFTLCFPLSICFCYDGNIFVYPGDTNYNIVKEFVLNPKAVSLGELYGEFDLNTNEWTDGILSSVMRVTCSGKSCHLNWIFALLN